MPKINKTKYAILGILSIKPCSGYDIKKFSDRSISYFWNENFGHIYPVLKQMEKEDLITKSTEYTEGRPPRNVYHITEKGEKALDGWLLTPAEDYSVRNEFLLKIFFARRIPLENIIQKIEKEKEKSLKVLDEISRIEKRLSTNMTKDDKDFPYWFATVRGGIKGIQYTIEWCEETLESFKALKEK